MALHVFYGLVAVGVAIGVAQWRLALFVMALIAAVQDPLRKLVPGAPGYLVLATALVLMAAIIGLVSNYPPWWRGFGWYFPRIRLAMALFVLACIPAALISATYGPGSWLLTLLGVFSYGSLLLSMVVGFYFAYGLGDIRRFLAFYCLVSSVMLVGGLIQYFELWPGARVIGTEALDMEWLRYGEGYIVKMIAGFYRSPDVMGWHAAAVAMLAVILAMTGRGPGRWLWFALTAAALVELLLCGRRKMVYMIPFFLLGVVVLYSLSGVRRQWFGFLGVVLLPLVSIGIIGDWLGDDSTQVRYYTDNPRDTVDQLHRHGFASVIGTYEQAGFFGSGLGVATPGSHHLQVARPRVWQESGPSRVMVELGVPGLLALVGVMVAVLSAAWRVTRYHLLATTPMAPYAVGLFAFFLANVGSLVVSGQILADPFIASFLGMSIGMVLSLARLPVPHPGWGWPGWQGWRGERPGRALESVARGAGGLGG